MAVDAALALVLAGLLVLGAAAIYYRAVGEHAGAEPVELPGNRLQVLVGSGDRRSGALVVTGYHEQAMQHHAVAIHRTTLNAGQFDFLRYRVGGDFPGPALSFTWRGSQDPGEVHSSPLHRNRGGTAVVRLDDHPQWRGEIVEIGVHAVTWNPGAALRIDALGLEPGSWRLALAAELSGWTAFRGWNQGSINFLLATAAAQGISPVPVAAAWAGLAAVILWLLGLHRGSHSPAAYAAAALVPWLAIDLLWQRELSAQLTETRARFAGKTVHERHLADLDAWVYNYIQRLKAEVLPSEPARIFIMHDARRHHYDRLKAQYYLLPHNVYNFAAGPAVNAYRPGDYILVMRDSSDPVAAPGGRMLRFSSGRRVPVRPLDSDVRGDLYQVRGRRPPHRGT